MGVVPLVLRLSLKGSSLMALNDHPFLTIDAAWEANRRMSSWPALGFRHASSLCAAFDFDCIFLVYGLSDEVPRERERSPHTSLPAPVPAPAPMYPPPWVPMMDTRRYRNLFPRCRVTPPTPPPSDDEPSYDDDEDREDSQSANDASLGSWDVSSAGASYGSERECTSCSSGPSDRSSLGSSSSRGSFRYGSGLGGSSSDASSEDDLVNRYFAGTFPPSMP
ncbi:hypothetical protein PIB30_065553 [Stylosanthes scabra]|uniref:Uncharacterized protein n=1 Tax=Stylosanthes scabra TaxID=79078 RepID=A0ABU6XNH9_9FABA|nr:hypothetical protein [Stylosanthes scabra]